MKLQPRSIAGYALCLAVSVQAAHGACLVLKGGASIEVRSVPKAKGAMVVFQDQNNKLASMRGTEVDLVATDAANARGVCGTALGIRDTPHPIAIQAPTEVDTSAPRASEILANNPDGAKAGPQSGASIDCDVVECGKEQEPLPLDGVERTMKDPAMDDGSQSSKSGRQQRPPSKAPSKDTGYGHYENVPTGGAAPPGAPMPKPPVVKPPVVVSPAKKPPM